MRILLLVGDNRIQASLSTTLRSLTSPLRAKLQILRQMIPGLLPAHPLKLQPLLQPISIVPHTLLMLRLSSAKLILVGHAHNSRPRLSLKISPELVLASLQFRKTLSLCKRHISSISPILPTPLILGFTALIVKLLTKLLLPQPAPIVILALSNMLKNTAETATATMTGRTLRSKNPSGSPKINSHLFPLSGGVVSATYPLLFS